MSLVARSVRRAFVGKRLFSTESTKVTIARNILLMKEISQAKDEEALTKIVAAGAPSVDTANPPAELASFGPYFALSNVSASEKFKPDPTAWQNMALGDMAAAEASRAETWPFIVGFV